LNRLQTSTFFSPYFNTSSYSNLISHGLCCEIFNFPSLLSDIYFFHLLLCLNCLCLPLRTDQWVFFMIIISLSYLPHSYALWHTYCIHFFLLEICFMERPFSFMCTLCFYEYIFIYYFLSLLSSFLFCFSLINQLTFWMRNKPFQNFQLIFLSFYSQLYIFPTILLSSLIVPCFFIGLSFRSCTCANISVRSFLRVSFAFSSKI